MHDVLEGVAPLEVKERKLMLQHLRTNFLHWSSSKKEYRASIMAT